MMRTTLFTIAATFAVALAACGQNAGRKVADGKEDGTVVPKGWDVVSMDEYGYSIACPDSLDMQSPGPMGAAFAISFPLDREADRFRENINLVVQDAPSGTTLEQCVESSVDGMRQLITGFDLSVNKAFDLNGNKSQKLVYTCKMGEFDLKIEQFMTVADDKAYILTYTAEAASFDKYRAVAEGIMNSFQIKNIFKDKLL